MANFHPSDNDLVEFAAGNLDWAISIAVAAHLEYCPECRDKLAKYNQLGGALLSESPTAEVSSGALGAVMSRIHKGGDHVSEAHKSEAPIPATRHISELEKSLPSVIRKLIPQEKRLRWRRISPCLQEARLQTGQQQYQVCFHKIKKGKKVVEHDHRGKEVTLVLDGSFSDSNGTYRVGDFIVKEPGDIHSPTATQNEDCLCFSVVAAPVKITGFLGRILNPLLSIRPA